MSREELMAYYNTFSCSVSVDDGEVLSGCGTYNIPVLSSDGNNVKFNLWVFDSGDYDEEGRYSCVKPDQIEWYKQTSDKLKAENNGEVVNSLVFQHIIVGEIYDKGVFCHWTLCSCISMLRHRCRNVRCYRKRNA